MTDHKRRFIWAKVKFNSQDTPHWEPIMETTCAYDDDDGPPHIYYDSCGSDEGIRLQEILKFGPELKPPAE